MRVILEEDQKLCPGLTANTPDNRIICCAFALHRRASASSSSPRTSTPASRATPWAWSPRISKPRRSISSSSTPAGENMTVPAATIDRLFSDKQLDLDVHGPAAPTNSLLLKDQQRPESHRDRAHPRGRHRSSPFAAGAARSSASCRAISSRPWPWICCWTIPSSWSP